MFNRLDGLNEQLVAGREDLFFRWQFAHETVHPLAETAIEHYIDSIARSPEALHASFAFYRAIDEDIVQNAQRAATTLTAPVLTIAGAQSLGSALEQAMAPVASDLRSVVIDDCGHFPSEEAPEATLAALTAFLAT